MPGSFSSPAGAAAARPLPMPMPHHQSPLAFHPQCFALRASWRLCTGTHPLCFFASVTPSSQNASPSPLTALTSIFFFQTELSPASCRKDTVPDTTW